MTILVLVTAYSAYAVLIQYNEYRGWRDLERWLLKAEQEAE